MHSTLKTTCRDRLSSNACPLPTSAAFGAQNTFTSMDSLVQHLSPAFAKQLSRNMTNKWETDRIVPTISRPILFLSGRADEIVPPHMMTSLYKVISAALPCPPPLMVGLIGTEGGSIRP